MFVRLKQNAQNTVQMPHSQSTSTLPICEFEPHLRPTHPLASYTKACHMDIPLPVNSCRVVL